MSATRGIEAIIFDLDGTLVDSRGDLAAAVDAVRAGLGLPPLAPGAIESMVGEGARLLVERALGGERRKSVLDAAIDEFFRHYDRLCLATTRPYPGVERALATLAAQCPLAVLTNKPERFAVRIVEALGLGRYVATVVGGDSLAVRKPDPATLRHVASSLGVEVHRILMVGDSRIDAEAAAQAGSLFVHVRWGYGRDQAAEEIGALGGLDDPERMAEQLTGLLAERRVASAGAI